jgi:hypothetical protein
MNHDQDLLSRLVDFHDHISVPPVPVTDDLHRGRRRVRRNRGMVAGGAALGIASVVFGASLITGEGSADRQQPVGPPTTDATSESALDDRGLTTPLVAPESILDVRELGFHVEPVPGFDPEGLGAGWSIDTQGQTVALRWDEVADDVLVSVRYQGATDLDDPIPGPGGLEALKVHGVPGQGQYHQTAYDFPGSWQQQDVEIHGVPGQYFEEPDGRYGSPGTFAAFLVWEYAPDSWAYVSTRSDRDDPGPERLKSALVEVAEAVEPGGEPVRLPVRAGAFPTSPTSIALTMSSDGWNAEVNFGSMRLTVLPGITKLTCELHDSYFDETSCLRGVDRKQKLAGLTVAPLENTSTWFDLQEALDA